LAAGKGRSIHTLADMTFWTSKTNNDIRHVEYHSDDSDDEKYVIQSDDEEQFACTICRQPFRRAVETMYTRETSKYQRHS
jgi:hypothetical protein